MSDGKVIIETKLDDKGAKKDLENLKKDIKSSFDDASKSVDSSVNKIGKSTSKISQSTKESSQKAKKEISESFQSASDNVGESTEKINEHVQKIPKNTKKPVEQVKQSFSKTFEDVAKESGKTADQIKQEIQSEAREYMKHGDTIQTAYKKAFENAGVTAETELNQMVESAEESANRTKESFSRVKDIGVAAFKAIAVAAVGATTAAVKVGSDFEAQMSRVKAISGATREEFQQLNDLAIQLGKDTAFSALEVAQGMENLASAGFTTNEIMDAMPGLLNLAAASGEDLATSSDIAASSIRGFGLEASDAAHVADVLAENANRTNSSVYETGEAMKYIAPVAKAMGISFEETAAAIGIMADAGIQGSQAGTTLRGALSRLSKPTDDMVTVMKKLGISFYDSQGKMKPLTEQIDMLKKATKGLTDEQKNQYLITLYGQESLSGMLALINEGPEKLDALTKSFETADGAAQKTADTMQDNLKGSVEQLGGSVETLGIRIYEKLSKPLRKLADVATDSVNQITEAFEGGGITGALSKIGELGSDFLMQFSEGFKNAVPQMLPLILDFVQQTANNLKESAPQMIESGYQFLSNFIDGFTSALPILIEQVPGIVTTISQTISENFPLILLKGAELIAQLAIGILQAVPTLVANIPAIIQAMVEAFFAYNWLSLGKNIIQLFSQGIKSAAGLAKSSAETVSKNVQKSLTKLPEYARNIGKKVIEFFSSGIKGKIGEAKSAATTIANGVKNVLNNLPSTLKTIGSKAIRFVSNGIRSGLGVAKSAATSIFNGIRNKLATLPNGMSQIGRNIVQGIGNGITGMAGWLYDKVANLASSIVSAAKKKLKISSPSKVARDEIGQWFAKGIYVGYEKYNPMNQIAKSLNAGINGIQQSLFAGVGATNNHNQTNNFYGIQTPDQVARSLRMQQIYGLAGAR